MSEITTAILKPKGFEDYLGSWEWVKGSKEHPYAWGWKIIQHMGDDKWAELSQSKEVKEMFCGGYSSGFNAHADWYAIAKELTLEEAEERYGKVSKVVLGPRGGFRKVILGDPTVDYPIEFYNPAYNPVDWDTWKTDPRVEIDQ